MHSYRPFALRGAFDNYRKIERTKPSGSKEKESSLSSDFVFSASGAVMEFQNSGRLSGFFEGTSEEYERTEGWGGTAKKKSSHLEPQGASGRKRPRHQRFDNGAERRWGEVGRPLQDWKTQGEMPTSYSRSSGQERNNGVLSRQATSSSASGESAASSRSRAGGPPFGFIVSSKKQSTLDQFYTVSSKKSDPLKKPENSKKEKIQSKIHDFVGSFFAVVPRARDRICGGEEERRKTRRHDRLNGGIIPETKRKKGGSSVDSFHIDDSDFDFDLEDAGEG